MSRYAPNQTGYTGFTCSGYPAYNLPAMDCVTNNYLSIPQDVERGKDVSTFYDTLGLADTTDFYTRLTVLNFNPDPITGNYVNLYKLFVDLGLDVTVFTAHCYDQDQPCNAPEKYSVGSLVPIQPIIPFTNPIPFFPTTSTVCGVVTRVVSTPSGNYDPGLYYFTGCCDSNGACTDTSDAIPIVLFSSCPTP